MTLALVDVQRTLGVGAGPVRDSLLSVLRRRGFEIVSQELTSFEARRGSAPSIVRDVAAVPVAVTVYLTVGEASCSLSIRIEDRCPAVLGRSGSLAGSSRNAIAETLAELDAALAALDPAAAPGFPSPAWWFATDPARPPTALDSVVARTTSVGARIASRAGRFLDGKTERSRASDPWRAITHVVFESEGLSLLVDVDRARAMLGVALFVASTPGSMPGALRADVERVAGMVESVRATSVGHMRVTLSGKDRPVVDFLFQQAELRERLAVRTLHRCRDCGLEKISNPDYKKVMMRNQRVRALGGSIGMSLGRGGISPFVLLGTLFRLRDIDPEFVCPRCQGMESDTRIVTFCPACGDRIDDTALRSCGRCGHDMRHAVSTAPWQSAAVASAAPVPPVEPALVSGTA